MNVPKEYLNFYNEIMSDEWLVKKIDREFRLYKEKEYIHTFLPEIKKGNLHILDIGAGPGEFSEIATEYKCKCFDIIAPPGQGPIFYEEYCRLNHLIHNIEFVQMNFYKYLKGGEPYIPNEKFDIINCKHAINLIFYDHMKIGNVPSNMTWIIDDKLKESFRKLFTFFNLTTKGGSIILISTLNSQNNKEYSNFITDCATTFGYTILMNNLLTHKMKRND